MGACLDSALSTRVATLTLCRTGRLCRYTVLPVFGLRGSRSLSFSAIVITDRSSSMVVGSQRRSFPRRRCPCLEQTKASRHVCNASTSFQAVVWRRVFSTVPSLTIYIELWSDFCHYRILQLLPILTPVLAHLHVLQFLCILRTVHC